MPVDARHDTSNQVRREIRRLGWDALWVSKPANRHYLTGFTGSAGWVLVPARGPALLLTDGRYTEQARQQTRGVRLLISQKDPRTQFAQVLNRRRLIRLGFEDEDLSVATWREVKRRFPGLKGFRASGLVEQFRARKQPREIANIRRAVQCTEAAFRVFRKRIKAGAGERELAFELEKIMLQKGANGLAFPTILASGPNSALPHASPGGRRLRKGDLVVIDFGCQVRGFHADLTRTLAVGRATGRQREVYRIVKRAQLAAGQKIMPGQPVSECDKTARSIFRRAGWEKHFVHSLGHGLGLEVHEGPRISRLSREKFQIGMALTCEPGLYFPGWGGVRIEDDLLVTARGVDWLSRSAEELEVIK
jgi:Xaa-Pro aminopeptidase